MDVSDSMDGPQSQSITTKFHFLSEATASAAHTNQGTVWIELNELELEVDGIDVAKLY